MVEIIFKRIHKDASVPEYQTPGSVAFDFCLVEDISIAPGAIAKTRTGLVIKTPDDHALLVISRSSNPVKKGIDLANSVGVVDSDYAGPSDELFLLLKNITNEEVTLKKGDRVAQGMFVPVTRGTMKEVEEMPHKNRGGHGSTGR